MRRRESNRHPCLFRVMQVDAELAGLLVAAAFVVLAVVGIPIAKWFVLGALLMGGMVALLLHVTQK